MGSITLAGFGLGLFLAAQVGPVTLLIVRSVLRGGRAIAGFETSADVVVPRRAFLTALAATALNPLTIALWTVSFPAAAPADARGSAVHAAALIVGVALGTLTWYCGFSTAFALARKRAGDRVLRAVDIVSGSGLVAFGGLLGYRAAHQH